MKEKRYYVEYCCPNTNTSWIKETNDRRRLKKLINNLTYSQAMWVYDRETKEIIFNKQVATDKISKNII